MHADCHDSTVSQTNSVDTLSAVVTWTLGFSRLIRRIMLMWNHNRLSTPVCFHKITSGRIRRNITFSLASQHVTSPYQSPSAIPYILRSLFKWRTSQLSKVFEVCSWPPTSIQSLRMSGFLRSPSIRPHNVIVMHTVSSTLTVHFTVIARPSTMAQQVMLTSCTGERPGSKAHRRGQIFWKRCNGMNEIWTVSFTNTSPAFRPRTVFVFHVLPATNNHYFPVQHSPIGLASESALCSLWGTKWIYILYSNVYNCKQCCLPTAVICTYCVYLTHTHTHPHTKTFDTRQNHSPTEDAPTCLLVQWAVNKKGRGEGERRQKTDRLAVSSKPSYLKHKQ